MSEFQRSQLAARAAKNTLERVVDLQAGSGQPWDLVDRFVSADVTHQEESWMVETLEDVLDI